MEKDELDNPAMWCQRERASCSKQCAKLHRTDEHGIAFRKLTYCLAVPLQAIVLSAIEFFGQCLCSAKQRLCKIETKLDH